MRCPSCKVISRNKVLDSRLTEGGAAVRRRRVCLECDRRYTTKERIEEDLRFSVSKNNGQRLPYRRDKVFAGVERACYKLSIPDGDIARLVDRVEGVLFANHEREVTTEQIGRYVGDELRRLSAVAYVRFMSVHRRFHTVGEFIDAIQTVREESARDDPAQQPLFDT
ncbi:MAG: transcriptional regulator NrdR [Phycisphaerae bacterium]